MKLPSIFTWASGRTFIVGEIVALVMLAKSCGQAPGTGMEAAGSAGSVADGGSDGSGGSEETGGSDLTGTGGEAGEGGATGGSEASTGGTGGTGAAGGTGGSAGSTGGSGGACEVYTCGAKDCGLVDNGCEAVADCGGCGDAMACGSDHTCSCPAEGNTPEAMAFCEGPTAEPAVADWCAWQGGCDTGLCGAPPVPKAPESCIFSGQKLADGTRIWCCATP